MAYISYNLSVLAYASGFTLWHYTTTDAVATVGAAGYFNDAADMLRRGDMILATGEAAEAGIFIVRANAAGVVDVVNLTPQKIAA